jgi:CRP/FNR family cyclic AMP-dependent transcriptional regulator
MHMTNTVRTYSSPIALPAVQDLREIPLLTDLSDGALARVASVAIRRSYASGEMITLEDDPCQAVYFIVEGQVRVYRLSFNGREQVLMRLGPGQALNTVSSFQPDGLNHAHAQALTPVTLYAIPRDDFLHLVATCPELATATLRDFADRLYHLANLVENLSLHTVRGRLARFLLQQAETGGVTRHWTQQEIATHVGTVRDMVGRTLRDFADRGLVRVERQRITLLDRAGLEVEAQD